MGLTKKDHLIPGGRIHNFRHFMDFPAKVFSQRKPNKETIYSSAICQYLEGNGCDLEKRCNAAFPLSFI